MANRYFEGTSHASSYAKFRPLYPKSLVEHMVSIAREKQGDHLSAAADIGCGSGQSTEFLSPYFTSVSGVDISEAQIIEAKKMNKHSNVSYMVGPAETLPFPDKSLSLVTAGEACHWFDMPKFYKEVDRVLVPGGVLALYGYPLEKPIYGDKTEELYEILKHVYDEETAGCWGEGRFDVDSAYKNEKFRIPYPDFCRDESHYIDKTVTVAELTGSITAWSGFQNLRAKNGEEAAQKILDEFQRRFMKTLDVTTSPEETSICLRFRYFLLMGSKPLD